MLFCVIVETDMIDSPFPSMLKTGLSILVVSNNCKIYFFHVLPRFPFRHKKNGFRPFFSYNCSSIDFRISSNSSGLSFSLGFLKLISASLCIGTR